jgi:hypothetical protein
VNALIIKDRLHINGLNLKHAMIKNQTLFLFLKIRKLLVVNVVEDNIKTPKVDAYIVRQVTTNQKIIII